LRHTLYDILMSKRYAVLEADNGLPKVTVEDEIETRIDERVTVGCPIREVKQGLRDTGPTGGTQGPQYTKWQPT